MSEHEATPISDPTVLRAIAHPVRNEILGELYAAGHLRAADVAEALGIPANQASFHLRQLAKYGLVQPAPEHARDGRDRVWKPVHARGLSLELKQMEADPGGRAAVSVWRRQAGARAQEMVARAYARPEEEGIQVAITEDWVHLTKDEAKQFAEELLAVQRRWQDKVVAEQREGRRTYHLLAVLQPAHADVRPEGAGDGD